MSVLPLMSIGLTTANRRLADSDRVQDDPNVQFVCPQCGFVLRVYGPPLAGDLFDRMRRHDCEGDAA